MTASLIIVYDIVMYQNLEYVLGQKITEICWVFPGSRVPSIPLLSSPLITTKGTPEGCVNLKIPSSRASHFSDRLNIHFKGLSLLLTKIVPLIKQKSMSLYSLSFISNQDIFIISCSHASLIIYKSSKDKTQNNLYFQTLNLLSCKSITIQAK